MIDSGIIDKNLQSLNAVTSSWSLPALPDNTKLDLASLDGVMPDTLATFSNGLAADIHQSLAPQPLALAVAPAQTPDVVQSNPLGSTTTPGQNLVTPPDQGLTFGDQAQRAFNSLANLAPPTKLDANGVEIFKSRAIQNGYLDPNTPIDNSWDPALNDVRYKMLTDEATQRYSGDRPGAASLEQIGQFLGDWLTPTGLLKAAVDLNFLPSVGRVERHASGFFHAISQFVQHGGIENFKDVLGNGAGELADVAVPVVNDLLLFTGVSEVYNFARFGILGAEALDAGAEALYAGSKIGRAAALLSTDVPAAVERFGEPSFNALQRLGTPGNAVRDTLNSWRELRGVTAAKGIASSVGKLGLAGRIENALPGSVGGNGLANIPVVGQTMSDYTKQIVTNPLVAGLVDNLLVPSYYFEPGTLGSLVKAGADPALAIPRKIFRMAPITDNQALTAEFHNGVLAHLQATAPEEATAYQDAVQRTSVKQALADKYAGGNTETLGRMMAYVTTAAAVDHAAAQAASAGGINSALDTEQWSRRYLTARNKYVSQLREWDPDNTEQLLRANAAKRAADAPGGSTFVAQYRRLTAQVASETEASGGTSALLDSLKAEAVAHNTNREGAVKDFLGTQIQPGVLEKYLPQAMPTFGNWSDFVAGSEATRSALENGVLDASKYIGPESPTGRPLSYFTGVKDAMPGLAGPLRGSQPLMPSPSTFGMTQLLAEPESYMHFLTHSLFAPLARAIDPGWGAFTVAAKDTFTKQDYLNFGGEVRRAQLLSNEARMAQQRGLGTEIFQPLEQLATDQGVSGIHELSNDTVLQFLEDNMAAGGAAGKGKNLDRINTLVSEMRRQGIGDFSSLQDSIGQRITDLTNTSAWGDSFGIPTQAMRDGKLQQLTLQQKYKTLITKAQRIAGEVDLTGEEPGLQDLAAQLDRHGYKLVHGVEFMTPHDLLDIAPFDDLGAQHLRELTFGNFFKPSTAPQAFRDAMRTNQQMKLVDAMSKLPEEAKGGLDITSLDSPDLNTVWDSLRGIIQNQRELSNQNLEAAQSKSLFGRRLSEWQASQGPKFVNDLGQNRMRQLLVDQMTKIGYTPEVAQATWQSVKEGGWLGKDQQFKNRGLYALEDYLTKQPAALNALQVMGASKGWGDLSVKAKLETAAMRAPAAVFGGYLANNLAGGGPQGALAGALGAVGGFYAGQKGAEALSNKIESGGWQRLAYIPEDLQHYRDNIRFKLNPFFDMHRAGSSLINAHLAAANEGITLPLRVTRAGFVRQFGNDAWTQNVNEFRDAMAGHFDFNALDDVRNYASDKGLLGFSQENAQAAAYGFLRQQGMDGEKASGFVRDALMHTTNRSAAELSTNFVLFPFSFQKHMLGNMARFIGQDMGRAVAIHDGMQAYNLLDSNFDIGHELQAYVPLANQLRYLNPYAYGVSPGQLGGINRPFINLFGPLAMNLFTRNGQGANVPDLHGVVDSLVSFNGQVRSMLDDLKSQGNVMFSPYHQSTANEIEDGYTQYHALRDRYQKLIGAYGYKVSELGHNTDLAGINQQYMSERSQLEQSHPAWKSSYQDSIANVSRNEAELAATERLVADSHGSPAQQLIVAYKKADDVEQQQMRDEGINTGDPANVPNDVYQRMQSLAYMYAKRDPSFLRLYKTYYMHQYGPITKEF